MTLDIDIYRTAKVLLDQHGKESALEARRRYNQFLEEGHEEGARLWHRIIEAIEWIQSEAKGARETAH